MQHASATRIIHAPPAAVWALLADVTRIKAWHPSVRDVDLLSERPTGMHAARRCHFHDGTSVREEVVAVEDGARVRLRMSEYSAPMQTLEAEFRVEATPEGWSRTTFEISYVVKWGVMGRLMSTLMVNGQLTKMANRVVAGLEKHATSGAQTAQAVAAA